jgi:hypothetical protein
LIENDYLLPNMAAKAVTGTPIQEATTGEYSRYVRCLGDNRGSLTGRPEIAADVCRNIERCR